MLCRFLAFCLMIACFACTPRVSEQTIADASTASTLMVEYGEDVIVDIGQRVQINKSAAGFTFTSVVSDNRCPKGMNCVQAGSATILVTLPDGSTRKVKVPAASRHPANFGVPAGSVDVLKLEPYPEADKKTDPEAYRLRVRIGTALTQ